MPQPTPSTVLEQGYVFKLEEVLEATESLLNRLGQTSAAQEIKIQNKGVWAKQRQLITDSMSLGNLEEVVKLLGEYSESWKGKNNARVNDLFVAQVLVAQEVVVGYLFSGNQDDLSKAVQYVRSTLTPLLPAHSTQSISTALISHSRNQYINITATTLPETQVIAPQHSGTLESVNQLLLRQEKDLLCVLCDEINKCSVSVGLGRVVGLGERMSLEERQRMEVMRTVPTRNTQTFFAHKSEVWMVAFAHNSQALLSASNDGQINLYSVEPSGQVKLESTVDAKLTIYCLRWSPDDKYVLTGLENGEIVLWQNKNWNLEKVRTIRAHSDRVISACWCSDSYRFLSSSFDLTIRFFNIHGVELCSHIKSIALYDIQSTTQVAPSQNSSNTKHRSNSIEHSDSGHQKNDVLHNGINGDSHGSKDVIEYFVCSCSIQHNRVKRFAVKKERRKLKDGSESVDTVLWETNLTDSFVEGQTSLLAPLNLNNTNAALSSILYCNSNDWNTPEQNTIQYNTIQKYKSSQNNIYRTSHGSSHSIKATTSAHNMSSTSSNTEFSDTTMVNSLHHNTPHHCNSGGEPKEKSKGVTQKSVFGCVVGDALYEWDLETGDLKRSFVGSTMKTSVLRPCLLHNVLCCGSDDGLIHLWSRDGSAIQCEPLLSLQAHSSRVNAVAYCETQAGQRLLASVSDDCTLRIWTVDEANNAVIVGNAGKKTRTKQSSTQLGVIQGSWSSTAEDDSEFSSDST